MQKSFKDVLEQLETTKQAKDFDTKEMSVPAWIEDLVKQYEKVKDIQKVKVSYCLHMVVYTIKILFYVLGINCFNNFDLQRVLD